MNALRMCGTFDLGCFPVILWSSGALAIFGKSYSQNVVPLVEFFSSDTFIKVLCDSLDVIA